MSECLCDGSGFFWVPDADGESAHEEACPATGPCCTLAVHDSTAGWWCPEHGDRHDR